MKLNPCYSILPVLLLAACGVAAGNPDRPQKLRIDKRYPPAATVGTPLTLQGRNFGDQTGKVRIGGKSVDVLSWSADKIVVKTPGDATTACETAHVVSAGGETSNAVPFAYGDRGVWMPNSEVPTARTFPLSVWTGDEMIVWGGSTPTGGRYNPLTDSWLPMTTVGAPVSNNNLNPGQAIWTGKEMLVLTGGSGARYNPEQDTWSPINPKSAPSNFGASAIWTGREMIVWGSTGGARYDPESDQWQAISDKAARGAVLPPDLKRNFHSAVWTGSSMIIWGGFGSVLQPLADGAIYHPGTDTWTSLALNAGFAGRGYHQAAWTGEEMLIWGGTASDVPFYPEHGFEFDGARYNPRTKTWRAMNKTGAPSGVWGAAGIWDGQQWIIFGGRYGGVFSMKSSSDTLSEPVEGGARYDPLTDQWTPLATSGKPEARAHGTAVWTGSDMLVWGGLKATREPLASGGRYNPATNKWASIAGVTGQPGPRSGFSLLWTGAEMLVWGGFLQTDGTFPPPAQGSRYIPATNEWVPMNEPDAPRGGPFSASVWTGSQMIVWGALFGEGDYEEMTGVTSPVAYRPSTREWSILSAPGAPSVGFGAGAVWTGDKMILMGGMDGDPMGGLSYEPATGKWFPLPVTGAPPGGFDPHLVWSGTEVFVYGSGSMFKEPIQNAGLNSGGRYNPATGLWAPLPKADFMDVGTLNVSLWTGKEFVVIGAHASRGATVIDTVFEAQGGRFDPETNQWTPLRLAGAPIGNYPEGVWTGKEIMVFSPPESQGANPPGKPLKGFRYSLAQETWSPIRCGCSKFDTMDIYFGTPQKTVWTGTDVQIWGLFGAVTFVP